MIIWMKTTNNILLKPAIEELKAYEVKDRKYTISAIPVTTSKLGPSGSSMNANSALEHMRDVMPRISSVVFLDLKYMLVIIH